MPDNYPLSQTILTRILRMQCLGFTFSPKPCEDGKLCASFQHTGWDASGAFYHEDLTVAVFEASKLALKQLAAKRLEHIRACKEAATIFTKFDPEKGLL